MSTTESDFSTRSREVIIHARNEAMRLYSLQIASEHLFLGIVKIDGRTRKVLSDLGLDIERIIATITTHVRNEGGSTSPKEVQLSRMAEKVLKIVDFETRLLKQRFAEPYHILLAILRIESDFIHQEFLRQRIDSKNVRAEIERRVGSGFLNLNGEYCGICSEVRQRPQYLFLN